MNANSKWADGDRASWLALMVLGAALFLLLFTLNRGAGLRSDAVPERQAGAVEDVPFEPDDVAIEQDDATIEPAVGRVGPALAAEVASQGRESAASEPPAAAPGPRSAPGPSAVGALIELVYTDADAVIREAEAYGFRVALPGEPFPPGEYLGYIDCPGFRLGFERSVYERMTHEVGALRGLPPGTHVVVQFRDGALVRR